MPEVKPPDIRRGSETDWKAVFVISLLIFIVTYMVTVAQFFRTIERSEYNVKECRAELKDTRALLNTDKMLESCWCSSSIRLLMECYKHLDETL